MQEVYWKVFSGLTLVGRKGRKLDCDEVSTKASAKLIGGGAPEVGEPCKSCPELGQGIQAPVHPHHPAIGCRLPWGTAWNLGWYGSLQLKAIPGEG